MDGQWIPLAGMVGLGLITMVSTIAHAMQLGRTVKSALQSLPIGASGVNIQVNDLRGRSVRIQIDATSATRRDRV
ncbi:hypothetical protein Val02_66190 [Virgisporangium aliadipatigenens]|uniref:Uncharacterized protein n=1 Tax=Virgisporangium aliadipatigenens TaxID=741659 RepID=A0A8J3YU04_9ACTN|nr:hypothetical protein [Virgisporangium aliadipatigenens]GIJ49733.1 hypothetical protein Val02_66190 [Virgisporangium aliadipatigenens]